MTGAGHWVAAPVGFVQAVESNVLSVQNSVGLQVCNPELLGIIEDAASFDSNCAGSWKRKRENNAEQLRHVSPDAGNPLRHALLSIEPGCLQHQQEDNHFIVFQHSPLQTGLEDQFPVFWHCISAWPSRT